jgi:hypothetical protein
VTSPEGGGKTTARESFFREISLAVKSGRKIS